MNDAIDEYLKTSSGQKTTAVAVTSTPIVEESDGRMSLIIWNVGTVPVWLQWRGPAVVGQGIRLGARDTAGAWMMDLSIDKHGRIVRGPVFAIGDGGAGVVSILESMHPCKCMRTGMEEPTYG